MARLRCGRSRPSGSRGSAYYQGICAVQSISVPLLFDGKRRFDRTFNFLQGVAMI